MLRAIFDLLCLIMAFLFMAANAYDVFTTKDYTHATWCIAMALFFVFSATRDVTKTPPRS